MRPFDPRSEQMVSFSLGLGALPWLLMGELFPRAARATASSAATMLNWTCSFVVTLSFASLVNALTPQGVFVLFALICAAGAVWVKAVVPETKGKTLEEISEVFSK